MEARGTMGSSAAAPFVGVSPTGCMGGHRKQARLRGGKYYFTGVACINGHIEKRITKNGKCTVCEKYKSRENSRKRRAPNQDAERKKATEAMRKWRLANPHASKEQMRKRRSDAAKRKKMQAQARAIYHANKEKFSIKHKKWAEKNSEKIAAHARNRRTRKMQADGSHTDAEILSLYGKQKGKCVYCKAPLKKEYQADHIIALINGGSNWISNIQLLCPACNRSKGAKDPIEWAQEKHGVLL